MAFCDAQMGVVDGAARHAIVVAAGRLATASADGEQVQATQPTPRAMYRKQIRYEKAHQVQQLNPCVHTIVLPNTDLTICLLQPLASFLH